jgi:hypothetical protein
MRLIRLMEKSQGKEYVYGHLEKSMKGILLMKKLQEKDCTYWPT